MKFGIELDDRQFQMLVRLGVDPGPPLRAAGMAGAERLRFAIVHAATGGVLRRRSGRLGDAWENAVVRTAQSGPRVDVELAVDAELAPYAGIQETGGEIRARNVEYLAIPVGPARGLDRSPRDISGLFAFRSRAGNLLLGMRTADGVEPWYVLKESVYLPASRYLTRAVDLVSDQISDVYVEAFRAHYQMAVAA